MFNLKLVSKGSERASFSEDFLIDKLSSLDIAVRKSAIIMLGQIGKEEYVPLLAPQLENSPSAFGEVRLAVLHAYQNIGSIKAEKQLIKILKTYKPNEGLYAASKFVKSVIKTLGIIRSREAIATLIPFLTSIQLEVGEEAVGALENIGRELVSDELKAYFKNQDNRVYFIGESLTRLESLTDGPINRWI